MSTEVPMLEKEIERRFVGKCKKLGWLCLKQNVSGRRGAPDRLVIKPDGTHIWVELKTLTGRLAEGQKDFIASLTGHKCKVYVVYGIDMALDVLEAENEESK